MKGSNMWQLIFFIASFVSLLSAAFMFASSENTAAKEASELAKAAIAKTAELRQDVINLGEALSDNDKAITHKLEGDETATKRLAELIAHSTINMEKLKQKIEWLEMKAVNSQKQKVTLSQDEPLRLQIIYRKAAPAKKLSDAEVKSKIISKIKTQMKELDN